MLEEAVVQVPFKFTFTSESVDGDGCGGESEPYFRNVRINGILVADNSDLPDCDDDTTCSLDRSFTVQVPDTQPTVTVHAEMWEDDSGSTCGDDDHEFTMDLVLDRITGVLISGTMSNPSQGDSGTIAPGATCATINGWGFCWSTSGTVEPPVQRVLFVPTCWNPFDQIAFDAAVDRWTRFFSDNSAIARCDHPDDPLGEKLGAVPELLTENKAISIA